MSLCVCVHIYACMYLFMCVWAFSKCLCLASHVRHTHTHTHTHKHTGLSSHVRHTLKFFLISLSSVINRSYISSTSHVHVSAKLYMCVYYLYLPFLGQQDQLPHL